MNSIKAYSGVSWKDVEVTGGYWAKRQQLNRDITLPAVLRFFQSSGRMDSMKGLYKPNPDGKDVLFDRANGREEGYLTPDGEIRKLTLSELQGDAPLLEGERVPRPHQYWDSDVAKWIEGASYALLHEKNPDVEVIIDNIVDSYECIQEKDGYLNTYFTFVEPGKRFTNIQQKHELYCAGHMIEAAIAYYQATGKRKYLDIMCRYGDYIDSVIGPENHKLHAYPGHQELELALIKLYRITGKLNYLKLSQYMINERGNRPLYFDIESKRENRNPNIPIGKGFDVRDGYAEGPYAHLQCALPLREQKEVVGHAVRMMYQCCGMIDVAVETNDKILLDLCKSLWDDVTLRKMHITGGVGPEPYGERFAFPYHLPNEQAYNETCAAIGFAMWAYRMLQVDLDSRYSDVLERLIYNGIISGLSHSGDSFFYSNHLGCTPQIYTNRIERQTRMMPLRQSDFPVSCCPANITRFIESISGYSMSKSDDSISIHLYMESTATIYLKNTQVRIEQKTTFPYDEEVRIAVFPESSVNFSMSLRIPDWSPGYRISVCGDSYHADVHKGYVTITRNWMLGDEIVLILNMTPMLVEAHPLVQANCGKVAIQCGPFVYCLEEVDNGPNIHDITLESDTVFEKHFSTDLFGGTTYLTAQALRRSMKSWDKNLYKNATFEYEACSIKAIPYYLWSNRGLGEMTVWINYIPSTGVAKA